jgi:hypothetical protein
MNFKSLLITIAALCKAGAAWSQPAGKPLRIKHGLEKRVDRPVLNDERQFLLM